MTIQFQVESVERYLPYTKAENEFPTIGVHAAGLISINERSYQQWFSSCKRVDLHLLTLKDINTGNALRAIGIKAVSEGGLTIIKNDKSKSKYISARGFMARYKVPSEGNNRLNCFFDEKQKMVIAPLANENFKVSELNSDETTKLNGDSGEHKGDIKNAVLQLCPFKSSGQLPLSIPELIQRVAEMQGIRLKARTKSNKLNFRARVNYAVKALQIEGKLEESKKEPWRRNLGTYKTFYYRVG